MIHDICSLLEDFRATYHHLDCDCYGLWSINILGRYYVAAEFMHDARPNDVGFRSDEE